MMKSTDSGAWAVERRSSYQPPWIESLGTAQEAMAQIQTFQLPTLP